MPKAKMPHTSKDEQAEAENTLDNALHDCKSLAGVLFNLYDHPEARDFDIPTDDVRGTVGILVDRLRDARSAADVLHRALESRTGAAARLSLRL